MTKLLRKKRNRALRSVDDNYAEDWTTSSFTIMNIVTRYSLPIVVNVSSTNQYKFVAGKIFHLEKRISIEQVTAGVVDLSQGDDNNQEKASKNSTIINIPEKYSGLFKVIQQEQSPEGVEGILKIMPKYVKVIKAADNISKQALITLEEGDVLKVSGTTTRATKHGIKKFLSCTLTSNGRPIALNPAWNGLYEPIDEEICTMSDILKRHRLPCTVTPVNLEKHSKALLDLLPNAGNLCNLVITSRTSASFVLGFDPINTSGIIMHEHVNLTFHIPVSSVTSKNVEEPRTKRKSVIGDLLVDQIIYGCKETLLLNKPWKNIFKGAPPEPTARKLQTHGQKPALHEVGVFTNDEGMMKKREETIKYISGPLHLKKTPKSPDTLPRPDLTPTFPKKAQRLRRKSSSLPDISRHMYQADQPLKHDILDRHGYLKLEDESSYTSSGDSSDYEDSYLKPIESNVVDDNTPKLVNTEGMWKTSVDDEHDYETPPQENDLSTQELTNEESFHSEFKDSFSENEEEIHDYELPDDQPQTTTKTKVPRVNYENNNLPTTSKYNVNKKKIQTLLMSKIHNVNKPFLSNTLQSDQKSPSKSPSKSTDMSEHTLDEQLMSSIIIGPITSTQQKPTVQENEYQIGGYSDDKDDDDMSDYEDMGDYEDVDGYEEVEDYEDVLAPSQIKGSDDNTNDHKHLSDHDTSPETNVFDVKSTSPSDQITTRPDSSESAHDEDIYSEVPIKTDVGSDETLKMKQIKAVGSPELPDQLELEHLSVDDVIKTLQLLRIPFDVQVQFRDQLIDGSLLKEMREVDFTKDFEMKPFHAIKLRKFIDGWRPNMN